MSNQVKIISIITFLIYEIFWCCLVLGGCSYIVFWMHYSGWWFVLAIVLLTASFKPKHWRSLYEKVSYEEKEDE
jgi:hypothetical protein